MYSLTDKQIDFILGDISARGVKTEDLQLNLLDHICCIIENELEENGDFAQFYNRLISSFYKKELKELENETQLLLTFKNYYTMKKIMIISGAFATATFVLGSLFKIMHWPGAAPMFLLGMVTGCFVFLPLMFTLKVRETKSLKDRFVFATGTLVAILFCLSSLFKVMHWPGSTIMWLVTLSILFFLFIPLYFFTGIRNPETKVNTITSSVLMIMIGGSLFLLTALRGRTITDNEAYHYIKSQDLVKHVQENLLKAPQSENKKLLLSINTKCEQLKGIIMDEEIGRTFLDKNFIDENVRFHEHNVKNSFFKNVVTMQILDDLKKEVMVYNSSVGIDPSAKISTEHSILDIKEDEYAYTSNLWMLNNLTLMQLELQCTGKQLVAEK